MEFIYFGKYKGQPAVMDTELRLPEELKGVSSVLKPAVPSGCCPSISCGRCGNRVCTVHACVITCGFSVCFIDTLMHLQACANGLL